MINSTFSPPVNSNSISNHSVNTNNSILNNSNNGHGRPLARSPNSPAPIRPTKLDRVINKDDIIIQESHQPSLSDSLGKSPISLISDRNSTVGGSMEKFKSLKNGINNLLNMHSKENGSGNSGIMAASTINSNISSISPLTITTVRGNNFKQGEEMEENSSSFLSIDKKVPLNELQKNQSSKEVTMNKSLNSNSNSSALSSSTSSTPTLSLTMNQIQSLIKHEVDKQTLLLRNDIQNLHCEIIKQFMMQQQMIKETIMEYDKNGQEDRIELQRLRIENEQLKARITM